MVDFGEVKTALGIGIQRDMKRGILTLNREKYAKDVMIQFHMQESKVVNMLLKPTG